MVQDLREVGELLSTYLTRLVRVLDDLPIFCVFLGAEFYNLYSLQLRKQHRSPLIPSTRRILAAEVNSDSKAASIVETYTQIT